MHDRGKIVAGLGAFVVVALIPFWSNLGRDAVARPQPKIVTQEKTCVLDTPTMRSSHMDLLATWRDTVVREGLRTTADAAGRPLEMSLTGTCLSCHSNREEFCDTCHNYLAVSPYCWDCHVQPERRT